VILDSSAIMMCFEFSIDLERELTGLLGSYHIVVPSSIIGELEFLSKKGTGNKKIKAKASLKLVENYETVSVDEKNADDSLISLAKRINGVVVTNDKELRKRLRDASVSVVFLRAKKKLMME
jgi:rRNA-processing protein FCF1